MRNNSNIKESLDDLKEKIAVETEKNKYYNILQSIREYCINNIDDDSCVRIKAIIEKEM